MQLALWMAFVSCLTAGCRRAETPPRWHACECTFITDYDQPGRHEVQVCGPTEDAVPLAQGCVRDQGVGVVEACRCYPLENAEPCGAGVPVCRTMAPH